MNDVAATGTCVGWSLMRLKGLGGGDPCGWGSPRVVGGHLCSPVWREVIGVVEAIRGLSFALVVGVCLLWLDVWRVL